MERGEDRNRTLTREEREGYFEFKASVGTSEEGRTVDALAPEAEEGRGKAAKRLGELSSQQ